MLKRRQECSFCRARLASSALGYHFCRQQLVQLRTSNPFEERMLCSEDPASGTLASFMVSCQALDMISLVLSKPTLLPKLSGEVAF